MLGNRHINDIRVRKEIDGKKQRVEASQEDMSKKFEADDGPDTVQNFL